MANVVLRISKKQGPVPVACLLALMLALLACTEEATLEGPNGLGAVVVEGRINRGEGATVVLTRTASPGGPAVFSLVTGARVSLEDNLGHREELLHLGSGHYHSFNIQGETAVSYTLTIETADEKITGHSVMPAIPIVVDSAIHQQGHDENGHLYSSIVLYFQDPPGQADYAWIRVYVTHPLLSKKYYFFYNDEGADGQYRELPLALPMLLYYGQTARVELFQADRQTYGFFQAVLERVQDSAAAQDEDAFFLAPPENLSANLSGLAPGYFSAAIRTEKSVAVQ
ncbi:MAG: DUF4249 domain-containing protein [Phaeodactylibacter sp.]|nr:DUF4249 domain-containing protein [Phaeodactylibacter sp.]MCB9273828.1 DUF4249 domain-containing protein [Lewinellaceae bacterium]